MHLWIHVCSSTLMVINLINYFGYFIDLIIGYAFIIVFGLSVSIKIFNSNLYLIFLYCVNIVDTANILTFEMHYRIDAVFKSIFSIYGICFRIWQWVSKVFICCHKLILLKKFLFSKHCSVAFALCPFECSWLRKSTPCLNKADF